jgi:hypothetical protein
MCGAYTLAQNGHVRGDFLYGSMRPRTQAALDLALYLLFFLPGIVALVYAGTDYAAYSWRINEHSNVTADGPPVYQFKAIIPLAGALVLLQGLAEILRAIICLQTGQWPARLKDAEEIDVVEQQLAGSIHVDDQARRMAIEQVHDIAGHGDLLDILRPAWGGPAKGNGGQCPSHGLRLYLNYKMSCNILQRKAKRPSRKNRQYTDIAKLFPIRGDAGAVRHHGFAQRQGL